LEQVMAYRLGVVSFLNARPLVEGLAEDPRVELIYDVPSALSELLETGRVDAALVPIVDVLRSEGRYQVVSDACIGSDGETMTVRVFSQVPPDRIRRISVDTDSHTSVALARVIFHELYDRGVELHPFDARGTTMETLEAVLLIGDKVVDPRRSGFAYEMDLGGAWRAHTGLPFVFAVWAVSESHEATKPPSHEGGVRSSALRESDQATRRPGDDGERRRPAGAKGRDQETKRRRDEVQGGAALSALLSAARDRGVARADQIARSAGPELGWTVLQAERYLTRCLRFTLDARAIEGANLFARLCERYGIVPANGTIRWPDTLQPQQATP
jgi:chorismate dehydratase